MCLLSSWEGWVEEEAASRMSGRSHRPTKEERLNNAAVDPSKSPHCSSRSFVSIPIDVAPTFRLGIVPQSHWCLAQGCGTD